MNFDFSIACTMPQPPVPVRPRGGHRNILFLLPRPAEAESNCPVTSHMIEIARSIARHSYVYVARHDQHEWEDDEFGVRYLPLDPDHLPSFGALEAVFVLEDRSLGLAAASEHPSAEVFVLEPRHEMKQAA
jgi:hypothetical protein